MKIIKVQTDTDGRIVASLGADSAILRPGEPVFVPEPSEEWRSAIVPAVRMCRLGKNLTEKAARAHFDAITAYHLLTTAVESEYIPYGLIDRTFSPGEAIVVGPAADAAMHTLAATLRPIGSDTVLCANDITFSVESLGAARIIAYLSRYCTFRTGDVVLFADYAMLLGAPRLDTALDVTLDNQSILHIRLK